jgi:predicted ATPase
MHLQRIQVPDFRVLQDVDITFEKEFVPSIFPLGSLNGGGKSTLLQLIFVLLHCSIDSNKIVFLKNMLNGFEIYKNSHKRILAIVDIWKGNKNVRLEFFSYRDCYVRDLLSQNGETEADYYDYLCFSAAKKTEELKDKISTKEKLIGDIENSIINLKNIENVKNYDDRELIIEEEIKRLYPAFERGDWITNIARKSLSFEDLLKLIQRELETFRLGFKKLQSEHRQAEIASKKVLEYLKSQKLICICNYSATENEEEVLLCQIDNLDTNEARYFLDKLSTKVFLAAPATQVFLFLPKESRKLLFRERVNDEKDDYYSDLQASKSRLSGFFAYDFLAVDILIEAFKVARDKDFREAIETGEYGNNYQELMKDLSLIMGNKKINLNVDFSGVNFKFDRDGENIELYPEDLSHGELKRLGIYMWIKSRNIENAIVLMDEIEIAFHPDWQYQIISDLQQWAPSNQYILATHSYELCQALTPAHVKELEPKLLKKQEA